MRENRPYGSEGGARFYSSLLPLSSVFFNFQRHAGSDASFFQQTEELRAIVQG